MILLDRRNLDENEARLDLLSLRWEFVDWLEPPLTLDGVFEDEVAWLWLVFRERRLKRRVESEISASVVDGKNELVRDILVDSDSGILFQIG